MVAHKIDSTKKWWPWILLGILVFALVGYYLVSSDYVKPNEELQDISIDETLQEGAAEIYEENDPTYTKADEERAEYLSFIGDRVKMGTDVAYTRNALVQLTNTVRSTAMEHDLNMDERLANIKERTATAKSDTTAVNLASQIKAVGAEIAVVLHTLQVKEFPNLTEETEEIEKTLSQIIVTEKITAQKEKITAFFDSCGELLKKMDQERKEE